MQIWSTVNVQAAERPAKFTTKSGDPITLKQLLAPVASLQNGHYYTQQLPYITGDLQTVLAARKNFHLDKVYYGRRLFNFKDSCVSVDYVVSQPGEKEDLEYAPRDDVPRPFPLNTRYLNTAEIEALDRSTSPLLISVHGLAGGAIEPYIRSSIVEMQKVAPEFDHCVLTSRGCNRSLMTTPQFFNACWTDDLRSLVNHVSTKQPKRPIYLVGYSLGGGIVANYLGQEAHQSKIAAACIASAPWDLNISSVVLENSFMGRNVYTKVMSANLMRLTLYQKDLMKQVYPYSEHLNKKINTVREYDNTFTCAAFGFDSAEDYYRHGSPVNRLRNIRTPTLVLAAKDDPICSDHMMPYTELAKNEFVHTVTTTGGGHLGWYALDGKKWNSSAIANYFKQFNDEIDLQSPPPKSPPTVRWFDGDRFQEKEVDPKSLRNV